MEVLITGGCGYLGSALAQLLLLKKHRVRVLDNLMHGPGPAWSSIGQDGYRFIRGDVLDVRVVEEAVRGVDAIVHLAAIVGDPNCARTPELAKAVNIDGSLVLLEAAKNAAVQRFIFASTCSNYGKLAENSEPATEDFALRPLSLYAETKVAMEKILLGANKDTLQPTVLRFATLYGLSPRMRFDLTVNEFVSDLLLKRKLTVYGEQFWRPYVHVRDAARAIELTLTSHAPLVDGRVFNVGDTAENYRKSDLVKIISRHLKSVDIEYVHKTEDPRDYKVCCDRIKKVLGFNITRTVEDGVEELIQAVSAILMDATPLSTIDLFQLPNSVSEVSSIR